MLLIEQSMMKHRQLTLVGGLVILGSVGCGVEDPDTVGTEVPGMTEDSETPTLQAPEPRNCVFIVQRENARVLSYSASSEQVSTSALSSVADTRFHWCMSIPGPTNLCVPAIPSTACSSP